MNEKTSWLNRPWTWKTYILSQIVPSAIGGLIAYVYMAGIGIMPTPKEWIELMKEKDYEKSLHKIE